MRQARFFLGRLCGVREKLFLFPSPNNTSLFFFLLGGERAGLRAEGTGHGKFLQTSPLGNHNRDRVYSGRVGCLGLLLVLVYSGVPDLLMLFVAFSRSQLPRSFFLVLRRRRRREEREKGSSDWEHHLEDLGFLFFWFLHVFTSREVGRPFLMTFFSSSFSCCFFLA